MSYSNALTDEQWALANFVFVGSTAPAARTLSRHRDRRAAPGRRRLAKSFENTTTSTTG